MEISLSKIHALSSKKRSLEICQRSSVQNPGPDLSKRSWQLFKPEITAVEM